MEREGASCITTAESLGCGGEIAGAGASEKPPAAPDPSPNHAEGRFRVGGAVRHPTQGRQSWLLTLSRLSLTAPIAEALHNGYSSVSNKAI